MLFLNFRKAIITVAFIMGALCLLAGYSGTAGYFMGNQGSKAMKEDLKAAAADTGENDLVSPGGEITAGKPAVKDGSPDKVFFTDCRIQRERTRGRQIELLREIVDNPETAAETRLKAQEQILFLSQCLGRETNVENLLRARGVKDAVVTIDARGVTVVLNSPNLSREEEQGIIDLVSRSTGIGEQGVIVINYKQ